MADSDENNLALLNTAVNTKAFILVMPSDESAPAINAQFVAHAKPTDPGFIWARPSLKDTETAKKWAAVQKQVSVRFSIEKTKAGAEAIIVKQIRDYWLTDTLPITAFLLQKPTKIWLERREHVRYQLRNDGGGIRATLASTHRNRAVRSIGPETQATLWDLGLGGAGFICPFDRALMEAAPNQTVEVNLEFALQKAVLPGLCVSAKPQGNHLRIGIKFDITSASPAAIVLLQRVIAELEKRTAQWEHRVA